jgi:hypothetical protein
MIAGAVRSATGHVLNVVTSGLSRLANRMSESVTVLERDAVPVPRAWATLPLATAALLLLASLGISLAYWPGLVTYDSIRQYDQALSGEFDDWHPPMMEWLWRGFLQVWPSPAPMLLLQLSLYGLGLWGLIVWAHRSERPGLAVAIGASALLPLPAALMGEVLKDCLMAASLTAAGSLVLLSLTKQRRALRIAAAALVVFAATLRFNAFLAGVPLLLAAAGPRFTRSWKRLAMAATLASALTLSAMPVANGLLGASPSDVNLSLVIFDLAGITAHSGQDAFPPLGKPDTVKIVTRCYSPIKWDSFSWWVEPLCPISFDNVRPIFHQRNIEPYGYLARQILTHPLAYAKHRMAHWNIGTRFLVSDIIDRPVQRVSAPNDWGFVDSKGAFLDSIDRVAMTIGAGPLGWPCCYLALACGLLLVSGRLPSALAIRMFAGSSLLYGLGYAVFGVASELRYYLWTMIATVLALAIATSDLVTISSRQRRSIALVAITPLAIVAIPAILFRV